MSLHRKVQQFGSVASPKGGFTEGAAVVGEEETPTTTGALLQSHTPYGPNGVPLPSTGEKSSNEAYVRRPVALLVVGDSSALQFLVELDAD